MPMMLNIFLLIPLKQREWFACGATWPCDRTSPTQNDRASPPCWFVSNLFRFRGRVFRVNSFLSYFISFSVPHNQPNAGKQITGFKRGKTCDGLQAQEDMEPASFKLGKTCDRCHTRGNMWPAPSAGKHVTGATQGKCMTSSKRGKSCDRCHARENIWPAPNAGKHVTSATYGKNVKRKLLRECGRKESRELRRRQVTFHLRSEDLNVSFFI